MGGTGSGRHYGSGKYTTSEYRKIDIRELKKEGLLRPGKSSIWNWSRNGVRIASIEIKALLDRINLSYKIKNHNDEWEEKEYSVYLEWTECNLGGQRVWFTCPAKGCGARVAVLYGGAIFACRKCHDLAYVSQRESYSDRAMRRADKIREKMGWKPGIAYPKGVKPKGMHWRTFERLSYKYDRHALRSLDATAKWLERFSRRKLG